MSSSQTKKADFSYLSKQFFDPRIDERKKTQDLMKTWGRITLFVSALILVYVAVIVVNCIKLEDITDKHLIFFSAGVGIYLIFLGFARYSKEKIAAKAAMKTSQLRSKLPKDLPDAIERLVREGDAQSLISALQKLNPEQFGKVVQCLIDNHANSQFTWDVLFDDSIFSKIDSRGAILAFIASEEANREGALEKLIAILSKLPSEGLLEVARSCAEEHPNAKITWDILFNDQIFSKLDRRAQKESIVAFVGTDEANSNSVVAAAKLVSILNKLPSEQIQEIVNILLDKNTQNGITWNVVFTPSILSQLNALILRNALLKYEKTPFASNIKIVESFITEVLKGSPSFREEVLNLLVHGQGESPLILWGIILDKEFFFTLPAFSDDRTLKPLSERADFIDPVSILLKCPTSLLQNFIANSHVCNSDLFFEFLKQYLNQDNYDEAFATWLLTDSQQYRVSREERDGAHCQRALVNQFAEYVLQNKTLVKQRKLLLQEPCLGLMETPLSAALRTQELEASRLGADLRGLNLPSATYTWVMTTATQKASLLPSSPSKESSPSTTTPSPTPLASSVARPLVSSPEQSHLIVELAFEALITQGNYAQALKWLERSSLTLGQKQKLVAQLSQTAYAQLIQEAYRTWRTAPPHVMFNASLFYNQELFQTLDCRVFEDGFIIAFMPEFFKGVPADINLVNAGEQGHRFNLFYGKKPTMPIQDGEYNYPYKWAQYYKNNFKNNKKHVKIPVKLLENRNEAIVRYFGIPLGRCRDLFLEELEKVRAEKKRDVQKAKKSKSTTKAQSSSSLAV